MDKPAVNRSTVEARHAIAEQQTLSEGVARKAGHAARCDDSNRCAGGIQTENGGKGRSGWAVDAADTGEPIPEIRSDNPTVGSRDGPQASQLITIPTPWDRWSVESAPGRPIEDLAGAAIYLNLGRTAIGAGYQLADTTGAFDPEQIVAAVDVAPLGLPLDACGDPVTFVADDPYSVHLAETGRLVPDVFLDPRSAIGANMAEQRPWRARFRDRGEVIAEESAAVLLLDVSLFTTVEPDQTAPFAALVDQCLAGTRDLEDLSNSSRHQATSASTLTLALTLA